MLGNINELIQQIMKQQRAMVPSGGVGMSDPNPQLIPGGSGGQQYPLGPLALLAQQMAAGSRQAPVNAPGVPQQSGPPQQSIPAPQLPGGGNQIFGYGNIRFNPFQQYGGGIMGASPRRSVY